MARQQGIAAGLVQLITLFPFPRQPLVAACRDCRAVLVPEMNMGQLSREVRRVLPDAIAIHKHNRIDGQLITPDELVKKLISI